MKFLFSAIALVFIFSGCTSSEKGSDNQEWTLFIFPDKNNSKRSMKQGVYPSLKMCQEASNAKLIQIDALEAGFSECGLNCSFHEGMKSVICERVVTKK